MAAVNPQYMKEVLSKPHAHRQDYEVRMAVDWLRNTVRHFKHLKNNVLRRLVEEGQTETFDEDELIILEGDIGHVMYILLTGKVSIYRKREIDSDDRKEEKLAIDSKQCYPDRSSFGEEVAVLENPGIIFGEIALIEDAPRSASIIANATTQLFTISRDLYARTVREVVEKEFRDKHEFINHTPCFQSWNPRYKQQLAMALHVANYDFEGMIARQGDHVRGIHYILRGQVRMSVISHNHVSQYGPTMSQDELERVLAMGVSQDESKTSPQTASPIRKLTPTQQRMERVRKSSNQTRPLEVCLLNGGTDETLRSSCFGDTEVILGFDTYLCSVQATEGTTVLELDMRSFDRLVLRRNARAIELMKEDNKKRLALWLERTQSKVPFFRYSLERLNDNKTAGKNLSRSHSDRARNGVSNSFSASSPHSPHAHNAASNTLQLPPNGPLVDQYGPGTVFNYIRQKDSEIKARKAHSNRADRNAEHRRNEDEERALEEVDRRKEIMDLIEAADNAHPPDSNPVIQSVTLAESEAMITDLEARLRTFLKVEDESKSSSNPFDTNGSSNKYKLQVTPLARTRKISDPFPTRSSNP